MISDISGSVKGALIFVENSWLLMFLHSIYVPYTFKKIAEAHPTSYAFRTLRNRNHFQLFFVNIILALGGGTMVSFLSGEPVSWIVNNKIIPTYAIGYYLVHSVPAVFQFLSSFAPFSDMILDCIVDGSMRAVIISANVDKIRRKISTNAYVAQLLLGVLSVTGGGIIYNVSFEDFKFSNDVYICAISNIFYIIGADENLKKIIYQICPIFFDYIYKTLGKPLGFSPKFLRDDAKALGAIIITTGFLLRFKEFKSVKTSNEKLKIHKEKSL
ncbi:hypothetical protein HK099_003711 [Clydaea vesicula]|uniref:Uncharacterized protein n=1 Tax=Clydaea vesicula TaxID=447962 RepID=A0AAD5U389_9FUNG|nr:hypothetical protein HK099_003711 [Clydaea vesicula]KAJ3380909.1 hypothetical protein HDU92_005687 [Lobulomyces angularis]